MKIFEKDYDGESMIDLERDIWESLSDVYNPVMMSVPSDEHGFLQGTFTVTITWRKE